VNVSGWSRGLEVTADGEGIVSHAGLALLRGLADKTGLTGGLSRALASARVLVHDRGRVAADLACAIADGARAISDFRVMRDQRELFGPVASVPTARGHVGGDRRRWYRDGEEDHGVGEHGSKARVGPDRGAARDAARGAGACHDNRLRREVLWFEWRCVNGQVVVPAGGQLKVPSGVDQRFLVAPPFLVRASRMR